MFGIGIFINILRIYADLWMNENGPTASISKTGKGCGRTVPVHLELSYGFDDIFEIGLEKGTGKNSILD